MDTFAKIEYRTDPKLEALAERAQDLMQAAVVERAEALETCVKSILRQVLNREPVLEDGIRMVLVTHPPTDFGKPLLRSVYFDDVYLGLIVEDIESVTFKPDKTFV